MEIPSPQTFGVGDSESIEQEGTHSSRLSWTVCNETAGWYRRVKKKFKSWNEWPGIRVPASTQATWEDILNAQAVVLWTINWDTPWIL